MVFTVLNVTAKHFTPLREEEMWASFFSDLSAPTIISFILACSPGNLGCCQKSEAVMCDLVIFQLFMEKTIHLLGVFCF